MRQVLVWAGRALLALAVVLLILGFWKRDEIARLQAVLTLFDADRIVSNFSTMDALFLTAPVDRGEEAVSPLPYGTQWDLPADVADWIARRSVTGMVILRGGVVVHESYHLGTRPEDLRIGWSLSKSVLSALTGILVAEGVVALDDPVTRHAPMLAGTAYDGTTLRDVLQMTSGVRFDEDYADFWSDINRMGRVIALGRSMDGFAAGLDVREAEPGTRWQYVSIDTHVVAMVLRGATGESLQALMAERLIGPLGVEAAPLYVTDGDGVAFALGGLNMTTRDWARFGQMMANGGIWQGRQIVPADWVDLSTSPGAHAGYGLSWWTPEGWPAGEFLGRGVYGQYLYINRNLGVVIAVNAADRDFEAPGVDAENLSVLRSIAARLVAAG